MKKGIKMTVCLLIVITCVIVALTGCNKDELESIYKPTNLCYDGTRITWNRVELAEHYTVQINGGEAKRVNTNMFDYKNDGGGSFDVTVNAVIGDQSIGETITFTPLDKIASLNVAENGMISWQAVPGATAYKVSVNGTEIEGEIVDTSYLPSVGSSRIKVRGIVSGDNGYYSVWSEEKQLFINHAPTQLKYDGAKLSWLGNSSKYNVNVNGTDTLVNGNTFDYSAGDFDFSVKIRAVGDHVSTFDSVEVENSFHYLQPVTNMVIEDGILNWTATPNAEGYEVRINGVVQKQNATTNSYANLVAGTALAVEVKPFNNSDNYFSKWSAVKNVYILESPVVTWNADLELDGQANNNFVWNAVNGAVGYTVELEKNGQIETHNFPISQVAFSYAYTQVGVYNVRVKAIADIGNDYFDSKYCTPVVVERLAAPKGASEYFITSDEKDLAKGFTVNYTNVNGAVGYQLYKDGALLNGKYSTTLSISDSDVADDSISSEQNYTYMVRSIGTVKNVNGKTYATLSCLSSEALSFNIKVLAMPTVPTMSGYVAEWQNVAGTNGYAVKYGGTITVANSTQYSLSTLKSGTYDVSVCAKGNGTTTLASNYTAPIVITRLVAPTNIKISYGTGEGQRSKC